MKRVAVYIIILYCLLVSAPVSASFSFLQAFIPKTHPSCAKSLLPHHKKFCASFAASAQCACASSGMPESMCKDMKSLHRRMITVFDSQKKACAFQRDTSAKICEDSWNCYRLGGKDSAGNLCQSSGAAC